MKFKAFLSILILTLYSVKALSQFIVAGTHDANEYYYNIIPDKILSISSTISGSDSLYLDVNNDNILDFKFYLEVNILSKFHHYESCTLIPLNHNQIAISGYDSCYANYPAGEFIYRLPMLNAFNPGDTINPNSMWCDTTGYLAFKNYAAYIPNGQGYSCNGNAAFLASNYIGLKVFIPNDTIFGWIKISNISSTSVNIEEYACNLYSACINNNITNTYSIYPNPSNGKFTLLNRSSFNKNQSIKIYNTTGKLIYSQKHPTEQLLIDLSSQPKGVYILFNESDNQIVCKKIILK